jgi:heat shock protein HtpX
MFNWIKTTILMAGIVALFGAVGLALGGAQGMLIALVIGAAMNVFAYWNSDKMVLRMYHAQEVDAQSGGRYYAIVRELAANAGLPMPRVYLINQAQPNAFATGRNPEHAAVAATSGIHERHGSGRHFHAGQLRHVFRRPR